jgi:hypothetical protein
MSRPLRNFSHAACREWKGVEEVDHCFWLLHPHPYIDITEYTVITITLQALLRVASELLYFDKCYY